MAAGNRLFAAAGALLLCLSVALVTACDNAERGDSGEIVDGGALDVFSMQVGDCFQDSDDTEVADVKAVPCNQPHDNEVFFIFLAASGSWRGNDELEAEATQGCIEPFEAYVGSVYEESRLDYSWMTPTKSSWEQHGDREIVCLLYDFNYEKLTGSMKGSRQ
jgi:hypothetical protein